MKKWTDEFISGVLYGLPPHSEYRWQVQKELEDHLAALALDLEDSGYSAEDAQKRALSLMGSPDELNRVYRVRFVQRQLKDPFYVLGRFFTLALLTGCYYLLAMCILGHIGFTHDAWFPNRVCYPMYGNPTYQYIYGAVVFTLPFTMNAFHLRRAFRLHPHPLTVITAGLLFTWSCEKMGLTILNAFLGSHTFFEVLVGGWCDVAPWLNLPYIIFSFWGCFILSLLFTPKQKPGGDPT